jgi:hypothetical protein
MNEKIVITEKIVVAFLKSKKVESEPWLDCPLSIFGGLTARQMAKELNNQYGDDTGWVSVLGAFRRIFE